jgi:hypothetical protein
MSPYNFPTLALSSSPSLLCARVEDLLVCHCPIFPQSRQHSFPEFIIGESANSHIAVLKSRYIARVSKYVQLDTPYTSSATWLLSAVHFCPLDSGGLLPSERDSNNRSVACTVQQRYRKSSFQHLLRRGAAKSCLGLLNGWLHQRRVFRQRHLFKQMARKPERSDHHCRILQGRVHGEGLARWEVFECLR